MPRARHLSVLPATREECRGGARPCPFVSCRYHLLLNVASDGRLYSQQQFDESDPVSIAEAVRALDETCALDVAERGEHTFEQVAAVMGIDAKDVFLHAQRAQEKIAVLVSDAHPDDPYFRLMAAQELRR